LSSLNKHVRAQALPPGSLTLVLNALEDRLMLALGRLYEQGGRETYFAQEWLSRARGVELLAPALDFALRGLGLEPAHIGRLAVVNGPGGFTGIRLVTVTASALARGLGAKQAALPYPSLLADAAAEARPGAEVFWVLIHARRGLVYMQGFTRREGPAPPRGLPLLALGLEEAARRLRESREPALLLGSGLRRNLDYFTAALGGAPAPEAEAASSRPLRYLPPDFDAPSPAFILRRALEMEASAYAFRDVAPLYARPSEAEENLPRIAAGLGLPPDKARLRLEELTGKK
jgi:tRNA threonylcarbamoyl adenosine modification protein YeaZ